MSELDSSIKSLSLSEYSQVFTNNESKYAAKDLQAVLPEVLEWSRSQEGLTTLEKYFSTNPIEFIRGLLLLNDTRGKILSVLVNSKETKGGDFFEGTLNHLKRIIKESTKSDKKFYLSIYFQLITEFRCIPNHLPSLMSDLSDDDLSPLILMILISNVRSNLAESFNFVQEYFDTFDIENEPTVDHFLDYINSLERIFPIVATLASKIYVEEKCLKAILTQVARISTSTTAPRRQGSSRTSTSSVTLSILRLVSSSCITDQCRTFNAKHYLSLLKSGTKMDEEDGLEDHEEIKILSTLCIVKVWNFIEAEKSNKDGEQGVTVSALYEILISAFKSSEVVPVLTNSIEGLAYLSLNIQVRKNLRQDELAIEKIIELIQAGSKEHITESGSSEIDSTFSSSTYGLIVILSNLSKPVETAHNAEGKTKSFLKSFATPDPNSKANKSGAKETQEDINLFNKALLNDHKIIEKLSKVKVYKNNDGVSSEQKNGKLTQLVLTIIYSITFLQDVTTRRELIRQGSLTMVLEYLINNSSINKETKETRPLSEATEADNEVRLSAVRALARMIISVNPRLAFNKYDPKTCLPFLVELFGINVSEYHGANNLTGEGNGDASYLNDVTNLDKFETLLALTNLSSDVSNDGLRRLIISKTFDRFVDNLLVESDIPSIQKAAWELVLNSIAEPTLLAKFFNLEKVENKKRLEILLKLLESNEEDLQVVIAGILANATSEFEMVDKILLDDKEIFESLLLRFSRVIQFQSSNKELVKRLAFVLANLAYASDNISELKENPRFKDCLKGLLQNNRNDPEILSEVTEIMQALK